MKGLLTAAVVLCFGVISSAHEMPTAKTAPDFDKVKKLEGHWEGTSKMGGDKETAVNADYSITSNGSAILEKFATGTPHEMVSVYTSEGKNVTMTHYCAFGNHPKMKLKKADDNTLLFEMAGTDGISSAKEPHMHSLLVTFKSPTEMTEEWTSYENGKKKETSLFTFAKK
jgi:hypothetical protein